MEKTRTSTVLIVDDEPTVLDSLSTYFAACSTLHVVDTATNGVEALEKLHHHPVDAVLADIRMPEMNGVELLRNVTQLPDPPVFVAMTSLEDDHYVAEILKNGGRGYILKSQPPHVIIRAVLDAIHGAALISPDAISSLLRLLPDEPPASISTAEPPCELSDTDQEVLTLLCQGMSNAEIAAKLHYSESTVKKRVSKLVRDHGCNSRLQLVVKYLGDPSNQ